MNPEDHPNPIYAPGFLESFPPGVREDVQHSLEKLQGHVHTLADQVGACTNELTAETVREAETLPEDEREARFDVLTAVNLIAESMHACARFDVETARELGEAAKRYSPQDEERGT